MDVRKAAPCVYHLLKNSDSGLVTVRNVIFYVDQQISVFEFAECEQVNFSVFRDTNLVLENVTITGNVNITFSQQEEDAEIEKRFVLAIFNGTKSGISVTDGLTFRLNGKKEAHRQYMNDVNTLPDKQVSIPSLKTRKF